jgi:hypothetical protein
MAKQDPKSLEDLMEKAAEEGAEIGDEVDIDLSEAETYEPFEADVPVEITTALLKRSKENHNPYIELKLRVFEGEYLGRVVFSNLNLTGKGAGFAFADLKSFGYEVDKDKPKVSVTRLIGLKAIAVCKPDDREGYSHKVKVKRIKRYVSEAEAATDDLK